MAGVFLGGVNILIVEILLVSYLAFLFPIAVYCLILAWVNRRTNPTMVSGVWDCIGLLLACSGILLISAPLLIGLKYIQNVENPIDDRAQMMSFSAIWEKWYLIWAFYYFVVLTGATLLTLSRRDKTVIYNVDPDMFDLALTRVIEKLNLTQARAGRKIFLAPLEIAPEQVTPSPASPASYSEERRGEMEIEPFPALSNLTLHWRDGSETLREEIVDELRRNLDECRSLDNPSSTWFLGISTMFFGLIFLVVVFVMLTMYFPPRRW
jgi:hypothetical protein